MNSYKLEFITPCFSKGAYEDRPEIRAASVRGQLHWWFRALAQDEKQIFGGVANGAVASKVVVRIGNVHGTTGELATLPHKRGGEASPKICYLPGTSCELHLLLRLGGLDTLLEKQLLRALEVWLLVGNLGLRSTRSGGCFRWKNLAEGTLNYPASWEAYEQRCQQLVQGTKLLFSLLSTAYENAESGRRVVTDTLGGKDQEGDLNDLRKLNWPLGDISSKKQRSLDPTRKERKTSPLRLRVVSIGNEYRIAAIWDGRGEVTGNQPSDLKGVIELLAARKPALGLQLAKSDLC